MEKLYTLRDACEILQLGPTTLRKWDREGKIRCVRVSNNYRRIPESELNRVLGVRKKRFDAIYARVSSHDQREDLDRQIQKPGEHAPGAPVFSDIRSRMRFNRKGFMELLNLIESDEISKIYITHKDRIARFGYDLVEDICKLHGTEIIETGGEEIASASEEMTRDLISIITPFRHVSMVEVE